jgi:hypothetical protein
LFCICSGEREPARTKSKKFAIHFPLPYRLLLMLNGYFFAFRRCSLLFKYVPDLLTTFYNVHAKPCYQCIYGLDILRGACIIAVRRRTA